MCRPRAEEASLLCGKMWVSRSLLQPPSRATSGETSSSWLPGFSTPSTDSQIEAGDRRDIALDACILDKDFAKTVLDTQNSTTAGWCELVQLAPNKAGGYIQLSFGGANKFALLHHVAVMTDEEMKERWLQEPGLEVSHRCHQPACKRPDHLCLESAADNNRRKGCLVWIPCPHCERKIILCPHTPFCIKADPAFTSMEQLVAEGACSRYNHSAASIELYGDVT